MERRTPNYVLACIQRAAAGPVMRRWKPPSWLLPHQRSAAQRIACSLGAFNGAILADAVGLGKTHVALAVATRYQSTTVLTPAVLRPQWESVANALRVRTVIESHESLSHGSSLHRSDLVVIDEAHHLRNPSTRRYDRVARDLRGAAVLCVTATPVVNHLRDLVNLMRLFLADGALGFLGVESLTASADRGDTSALHKATAPLTVARSSHTVDLPADTLPRAHDHPVAAMPTLPCDELDIVLDKLDGLTFPTFGSASAQMLLRHHLHHRLSSSSVACAESLRRHVSYLDRAVAAAQGGERLTRSDARRLFGPGDDLQFELSLPTRNPAIPVAELTAERTRLQTIIHGDALRCPQNPKADHLHSLLRARDGFRTIVFTCATATALDLARRLQWDGAAVVAGGNAWIATGRCQVHDVLDWFAPRARKRTRQHPRFRVAVLIATDIASEGLDLHDADAVVHYDLPWTPLRLSQRIGRVMRLGTQHRVAHVYWYSAPPQLERRLSLNGRIEHKLRAQVETAVPTSSRVGRSTIWNARIEARESLANTCGDQPDGSVFAVVQGPLAVLAAVRWVTSTASVPDVIALGGRALRVIDDFTRIEQLALTLRQALPTDASPPLLGARALTRLLQTRLRAAIHPLPGTESRNLAREVLFRARTAYRGREAQKLNSLNCALDHLDAGLTIGRERELATLLRVEAFDALRTWGAERQRRIRVLDFRVDAVLFGDGSLHL